jgi:hypothetical protein
MQTHYPMDSTLAIMRAHGGRAVYTLEATDTAWDPTSTKGRTIRGPAVVTYTQHSDGGIDAKVEPRTAELTQVNIRDVLERELTLNQTLAVFGLTHESAGKTPGVRIIRDANGRQLARGRADQVWDWLRGVAGVPLEG